MSESSRGAHPRLTIRHVLADAYRAILALDSPLLRVIRDLTLRPGQFVRRYVDGERTGVVGPVKYALLTLTVSVIAGQLGWEPLSPDLSPEDLAWRQAFDAAHALRAYIALLVLIPTAMVQRTLFWRRPFNLAETYVFLAYVTGHWIWLAILELLLPKSIAAFPPVSFLLHAVPYLYIPWAVCGFYGSRSLSVIARALLVFPTFTAMLTIGLWIAMIGWESGLRW